MKCLNLKRTFPQYRTTYDPAAEDHKDPWMFQIPGKRGTIYPHGPDTLAVEVDYRRGAVKALERLGLLHLQNGDGEHTFLFTPEDFKAVARIVKPLRKRQLSKQERERRRERIKAARLSLSRKS